ncbi:unnamed protein product, partial [Polarella glacialis]
STAVSLEPLPVRSNAGSTCGELPREGTAREMFESRFLEGLACDFQAEEILESGGSGGGPGKDLLANMETPWLCSRAFLADFLALSLVAAFMGAFSTAYMWLVGDKTEQWLSAVSPHGKYPEDAESVKTLQGAPLWVPLCWAGGTAVGVLKVLLGVDEVPSFLQEIQHQAADPNLAGKTLVCCVASLMTGAALGPEAGLAAVGGAAGTLAANVFCSGAWVPPERKEERRKLLVLGGITAAFGSIVPAPWIAVLLCWEIAAQKGDEEGSEMRLFGRRKLTLLGWAATLAFVMRYHIRPMKPVPLYGSLMDKAYDNTMPFKALGLGLAAGVMIIVYFIIAGISKALFQRLGKVLTRRCGKPGRIIGLASCAGLLTGLLGWAVPLCLMDGQAAMASTVKHVQSGDLLLEDLVFVALAKCAAYWVAASGGLVGGILFPLMYLGLVFGEIMAHFPGFQHFNQLPGAAFTVPVLMSSLPASIIPVPFTMVALPVTLFGLGPLWCVPLFVAVLASYSVVVGSGLLRRLLLRATAVST